MSTPSKSHAHAHAAMNSSHASSAKKRRRTTTANTATTPNNTNNTNNRSGSKSLGASPKAIAASSSSATTSPCKQLSYAERMKHFKQNSSSAKKPSLKIQTVLSSAFGGGSGGEGHGGECGAAPVSSAVNLHGSLSKEELLKIRMQQRDICYVAGLPRTVCTRATLSSKKWFGAFGRMKDVTITDNANCIRTNWMCVHVKFFDTQSAAKAVKAMNHKKLDDGRVLEANYGTQRYCEYFVNNKKCHKLNCPFRHNWCQLSEVVNFNQHQHHQHQNHHQNQTNKFMPQAPQSQAQQPQQQQWQQQSHSQSQSYTMLHAHKLPPPPQPQPQVALVSHGSHSSSHSGTGTGSSGSGSPGKTHTHTQNLKSVMPKYVPKQLQAPQVPAQTPQLASIHTHSHSVPSTHSSMDAFKENNNGLHSDENGTNSGGNYYLRSTTKSVHDEDAYDEEDMIGDVHHDHDEEEEEHGEDDAYTFEPGNENEDVEPAPSPVLPAVVVVDEREHNEQTAMIAHYQQQLSELQDTFAQMRALKAENSAQTTEISGLEQEIVRTQDKCVRLQQQRDSLQVHHDRMRSENELLIASQNNMEYAYNELLAKCRDLESQISSIKATYSNSHSHSHSHNNRSNSHGTSMSTSASLDYALWQPTDVIAWILSLHNGLFKKYAQPLQMTVMLEKVDGSLLKRATATDVHRWGVSEYRDQHVLLESIRRLKSNLDLGADLEQLFVGAPPQPQQPQQQQPRPTPQNVSPMMQNNMRNGMHMHRPQPHMAMPMSMPKYSNMNAGYPSQMQPQHQHEHHRSMNGSGGGNMNGMMDMRRPSPSSSTTPSHSHSQQPHYPQQYSHHHPQQQQQQHVASHAQNNVSPLNHHRHLSPHSAHSSSHSNRMHFNGHM